MSLAFTDLQTTSHNYFDPNIHNEVYESSPFMAKLKQGNKINYDGGIYVQFAIHYQKLGRGGATGPREQIVFGSNDTRTAAVLPWTYYSVDTTIHWDERVQNAGHGKIIDLAKDKAKELKDELHYHMAYDMLTATTQGTNAMVPLDDIVDSTTTYGGIAYTDAPDWLSTEDSSTTTMTLYGTGSLSYMFNAATYGSSGPTLFLTTR
ncbi:MAG: phage major capsid protein, partial [Phycisphaerae bacterium]|nr:phage major capsid protein [Phycisphaerae bacterium]